MFYSKFLFIYGCNAGDASTDGGYLFLCRSAEKEICLLHFLKDIYKVILLKAFSPKQNFLVATIYYFHNSFLFAAGHVL